MRHPMQLRSQPFRMIRCGQKTIELRLYDEKRQQIKVGDEIEFCCSQGREKPFAVRVVALHRFDDFAQLYASLPLLKCGYTEDTVKHASPDDMDAYYSKEKQAQYGVVGIEVERLAPTASLLAASRFLSLILRHKPEAAGITLDEHGWADVPQLLRGMACRHPLTMAQLEEIVRTDNKQRYAFNSDKTKLRANQGHSVRVDVGLEQLKPPAVLYHGTGEKYGDSILSEGLIPKTRLYVHLSKDTDTAQTVGARHGTPVVFVVESGRMHRDGFEFYCSQNGVWLTAHVPPAYLRRDDG